MTESLETGKRSERPRRKGMDVIADVVRTLPGAPGVYRMLDAKGDVLYVGKARDLKKRVASYTKLGGHTMRIARMISLTAAMEVITTASETEALLLEASLIKRLKPRYNVHLRDDKSFPYILIAREHEAPRIRKHRGARSAQGDYFGPFASAGAVNRTLNTLQKAFLLRSCTDSVYENRTRPCLLYQIKRCSAPCTGEISLADYNALVDEAAAFLSGESTRTQEHLIRQMEEASETLDFERAAALRDRIRALSAIRAHHGVDSAQTGDADVVAAASRGGQTCVQVFFYRSGQNWGTRAYFPRHDKSDSEAEVLDAFLAQFYGDKPPPPRILLNRDVPGRTLLEQALTLKAGRKVAVHVPQRGQKRALVEMAARNAREALGRHLAESASQRKLLNEVADTFDLDGPPRRIEVYDNSHIQGTNPVGAMIVAGPEGFKKSHYRKFNIRNKELAPGDDYAMMREVLTRRFTRLIKEGEVPDGSGGDWPDLVLIDGGQGQLGAARAVLADLGIEDVPLAAISKGPDRNAGRETLHMPGRMPFALDPRSPVLYYLQRLRDEAHRFAIGSHRARRKKDISRNPLDDIKGIGAARKKALLHRFGSARGVERAAPAELESVEGISREMAQRIHDYFRQG